MSIREILSEGLAIGEERRGVMATRISILFTALASIIAIVILFLLLRSHYEPPAQAAPAVVPTSKICILADGHPAYMQIFMGGDDSMTISYIDGDGNLIVRPYRRAAFTSNYSLAGDPIVIPGATCLNRSAP